MKKAIELLPNVNNLFKIMNFSLSLPSSARDVFILVLVSSTFLGFWNVNLVLGEEYDPNFCKGITCKPKPTEGVCIARNATTLSATTSYGPQRICCSVYACTHSNGTTTLHYGMSGQKPVKTMSRNSSGASSMTKKASKNETCNGVTCLGGQPSPNCRKSSPGSILNLMRMGEDCCPMWTCTFGGNGSLYYVHSGMFQKTTYWRSGESIDSDLSKAFTERPPAANKTVKTGSKTVMGKGSKVVMVKEEWDIALDATWGSRAMEFGRSDSTICDRVACVPQQEELTCGQVKGEENLKLLALAGQSCCPLYKCSGKSKMYLVQFGMYYAEPPPNNTITENPEASGAPPVLAETTVAVTAPRQTSPKPKSKQKGRGIERVKPVLTTAAPALVVSTTKPKPKQRGRGIERVKPVLTTTAPTPLVSSTNAVKQLTTVEPILTTAQVVVTTEVPVETVPTTITTTKTTKKPGITTTTTTQKPTTTTTTTEKPMTTTTKATEKLTPATTMATQKPAITAIMTTQKLTTIKTTTTKKPITPTKVPTTKKPVITTQPSPVPVLTTAQPSSVPVLTTVAPSEKSTAPDPTAAPNPKETTPAEVLMIDTPPTPVPYSPENSIRNSTVKKAQCRNMKCFPAPDKDKCVESKITDCELLLLLGSAVDCCPAYKCSSDSGDKYTLQFGITDGVSESMVNGAEAEDGDDDDKKDAKQCDDDSTYEPDATPPPNQIRKVENRYSFDYENHEGNITPKPVIIFDVHIQHAKFSRKSVRYVKSCKSVNCLPPSGGGWSKTRCSKLPKGTVPKQLKPKGVTDSCCGVWKCPPNSKKKKGSHSLHYGFTRSPKVSIVFEYNKGKVNRLPKVLILKDAAPEPLQESKQCPGVLCSPPLQYAECVKAKSSAIKLPNGCLRKKKECCPLWKCKRKDGSDIIMYGRTSPKGYTSKGGIKSILMSSKLKPKLRKEAGSNSKGSKRNNKMVEDDEDGDVGDSETDDDETTESDSLIEDDPTIEDEEQDQEQSRPMPRQQLRPQPYLQQGQDPMLFELQRQNQMMMERQQTQLRVMMQGGGGGGGSVGGSRMVMNNQMGMGGGSPGGIGMHQQMTIYR